MNLGQIRTAVRKLVQDPDSAHFSNSDLNDAINEAVRSICRDHRCAMEWLGASSIGSGEYVFSVEVIEVKKVARSGQPPLLPLSRRNANNLSDTWLSDAGEPTHWLFPNQVDSLGRPTVRVIPAPTAPLTDLIGLSVFVPNAMAGDSDVPKIPLAYHEKLKYEAALVAVQTLGEATDGLPIALWSAEAQKLRKQIKRANREAAPLGTAYPEPF